jgi:hypothetical protein
LVRSELGVALRRLPRSLLEPVPRELRTDVVERGEPKPVVLVADLQPVIEEFGRARLRLKPPGDSPMGSPIIRRRLSQKRQTRTEQKRSTRRFRVSRAWGEVKSGRAEDE